MSTVLYRKYRSQNFDQLYGQEHITSVLKNAVAKGNLAHAYLFVGSRGTGKTSTARILAKAVNCDNAKDGNPCNECSRCEAITNGSYLDLIEIDAASNRGIEQIRELKERIEFLPTEGKYKVYIIDEVHMLTTEAFNALLKTLEEPPEHVIFILATTDVHKLPATILSRCQRYDFRLGSKEEITDFLLEICRREALPLAADALEIIVENAHGSYRDALSLLDVILASPHIQGATTEGENKEDGKSGKKKAAKGEGAIGQTITASDVRELLGLPDISYVHDFINKLAQTDTAAMLTLFATLEQKGVNASQFVKLVISNLRDVLVSLMKGEPVAAPLNFLTPDDIPIVKQWIYKLIGVEREMKNSSYEYLPLELFVADMVSQQVGSSDGVESGSDAQIEKQKSEKLTEKVLQKAVSKVAREGKPKKASQADDENSSVHTTVKSKRSSVDTGVTTNQVKGEKANAPQETANAAGDLTFKEIEEKWSDVIANIKIHNAPLASILSNAKLEGFEDALLSISVGFEFHKEQLESVNTKELFNEVCRSVYECAIPFQCNVNAKLRQKTKKASDMVLKSIQRSQAAVEAAAKAAKNAPAKATPAGEKPPKRKVSKKVEAIFAGL